MFKRIIPLASAMLMLVSCGGGAKPATEIVLDDPLSKIILSKKNVNAKTGENLKVVADCSLLEDFDESSGGLLFINSSSEPNAQAELVDFIDTNSSYTVELNDKKMERFPGTLEEWIDLVNKKEANDTFLYFYQDETPDMKGYTLGFCHYDYDKDDVIKFTFKNKTKLENSMILFAASFTH